MSVVRNPSPGFELKSTALTLVAVILRTTDLGALEHAMEARFGDAPDLFDREPVAIDLSAVRDATAPIDFGALVALLRGRGMWPIAAKGGSEAQMQAATAAGLVAGQDAPHRQNPPPPELVPVSVQPVATSAPVQARSTDEVDASDAAAPASPLPGVPTDSTPRVRTALVVDKPLRSGQRVYAKDSDLIVLAVVSYGAEVIADGNIHVYAPLRGRALAGARGDTSARIFCTCMEPQLVSIAGIYRTTETELPAAVLGKAAQVWLDGERLVVEAMNY